MAEREIFLVGAAPATDAASPYPPSWINVATDWIHSRRWSPWLTYAVLTVISVLVSNSQNWLSGQSVGFTFAQTAWGVLTVALFAAVDILDSVAGSAFDAFRPALGATPMDEARARYELTTIPRAMALVILGLSVPFTALYYLEDPVASQIVGLAPAALVVRLLFEALFSAILLTVLGQAIRQLRLVRRLHAVAIHVDPFRPAPLHAFSRLTSLTGLALIVVIGLGVALNPAALQGSTFELLWLPWLVGFPIVALAIFIAPLVGMHGRLAEIKGELQAASEQRIRSLLDVLHADVDAVDLARADGLQKTLASLVQERDILAKLPTWPWSTGTLRGFLSALLLPIVLFLIQRYLSQVV